FRGTGEIERVAARGRGHCVHDLHVAGAAADVAAERRRDRLAVVGAAVRDVRLRRHQQTGGAEAALGRVVVDEGGLHWVEVLRCAETLHGGDLAAVERSYGHEA